MVSGRMHRTIKTIGYRLTHKRLCHPSSGLTLAQHIKVQSYTHKGSTSKAGSMTHAGALIFIMNAGGLNGTRWRRCRETWRLPWKSARLFV